MDPLFDPADFRIAPGVTHVCAGGETPFLRRHDQAFGAYAAAKSLGPSGRRVQEAKAALVAGRAARMFGVDVGDVGIVSSVAEGMSMLVESLDWRDGDEVLVDADEYPSVVAPLAQHGVALRFVPMLDPDAVAAAVTTRTRMIAVSAVSYLTGARHDLVALRAVADRAGALLVVDFTQGAGWMPIDATVADFAFSATYKWLLGTTGTAIAYWNQARQPDWAPSTAGWYSLGGGLDRPDWSRKPQLLPDAGRFTRGNPSFVGLFVLDGALDYLEQFGMARIATHVQALTVGMLQRLATAGVPSTTPADPRRHGASVCVASRHAAEICDALGERGILAWNGRGRVRVSFHGYNGSADMERAADALITEWQSEAA